MSKGKLILFCAAGLILTWMAGCAGRNSGRETRLPPAPAETVAPTLQERTAPMAA
ncbi:hypothetical protein [Gorillibacterium sp. sgz5001074]|uniref:hypothetical protein n=1 Tax=Gorillibacterium sp. sgz5001074 TaxID=3446695 RepID=UPI003F681B6A